MDEEDRRSVELQALNKKLYQEEQEKQAILKQWEAKRASIRNWQMVSM